MNLRLLYYSVYAIIYLEIFIIKIIGLYRIAHTCSNSHKNKNKNHNLNFFKMVDLGFYPHAFYSKVEAPPAVSGPLSLPFLILPGQD